MEHSKFDQIVHYVTESDLDDTQIALKVLELFPEFDDTDCYNDRFVKPVNMDKLAHSLSLGLSLVEAAYTVPLTATVVKELYHGVRVSLEALVNFSQTLLYAKAQMKAKHLAEIESSDGVTSSIQFLEKAYSDKYGDRKIIDIQTGFSEADEDDGWEIEVHHVENQIKKSADEAAFEEVKSDSE